MKHFFFIIIGFLYVGCSSIDLSLKTGRIPVAKSSKGTVYFYRIVNGLSTDAYFLSMKNDICEGFNEREEFYFRVLDPLIYYKIKSDTLFVYTSIPATQPDDFRFPVKQQKILNSETQQYENSYKEGQIQKVIIDSIYSVKCDVSY